MVNGLQVLGLGLFGLLVALAVAPPAATPTTPAPWFEVYHFDSQTEGSAFREVFRVHRVEGPAIPVANVTVLRDGMPLVVEWRDADGVVSEGDRLEFVQEAFDAQQTLAAEAGGAKVMECRYGGGAGRPVEPDEAARHGLLRCLFEAQE